MPLPRVATIFSSALLLLSLCGCSLPGDTASSASAAPNLGGNWLLAGSMPFGPLPLSDSQSPSNAFGISATFTVVGATVTGAVALMSTCSNGSFFFSQTSRTVVTGMVGGDGSFVLQQPPSPTGLAPSLSLTVRGAAPVTAGGAWNGAYDYAIPANASPCNAAVSGSGNIDATQVPALNATYAGAAATSLFQPGYTIATTLKQGATETNSAGVTFTDWLPLSGTITFTGQGCLTTGTPGTLTGTSPTGLSLPPFSGAVESNQFLAVYKMNDGSIIELLGAIATPDASTLSVILSTVQAGTCATLPGSLAAFTLTRQ